MKARLFSILVSILLILISTSTYAQEPAIPLGSKTGAVKVLGRLYIDSILYLPVRIPGLSPLRNGGLATDTLDGYAYIYMKDQWVRLATIDDIGDVELPYKNGRGILITGGDTINIADTISLEVVATDTTYKPWVYNPATKRFYQMQGWPGTTGGGGPSYTFSNGVKLVSSDVRAGGNFNTDSISYKSSSDQIFRVQVRPSHNSLFYSDFIQERTQISQKVYSGNANTYGLTAVGSSSIENTVRDNLIPTAFGTLVTSLGSVQAATYDGTKGRGLYVTPSAVYIARENATFISNWFTADSSIHYVRQVYNNSDTSTYTDETLIPKKYLNQRLSSIVSGIPTITASNGLTKTGNDITLGGNLSGSTTVNANSNAFFLNGASTSGEGLRITFSNPLMLAGLTTVSNDGNALRRIFLDTGRAVLYAAETYSGSPYKNARFSVSSYGIFAETDNGFYLKRGGGSYFAGINTTTNAYNLSTADTTNKLLVINPTTGLVSTYSGAWFNGSNFANTNLTFNASRSHSLAGFGLTLSNVDDFYVFGNQDGSVFLQQSYGGRTSQIYSYNRNIGLYVSQSGVASTTFDIRPAEESGSNRYGFSLTSVTTSPYGIQSYITHYRDSVVNGISNGDYRIRPLSNTTDTSTTYLLAIDRNTGRLYNYTGGWPSGSGPSTNFANTNLTLTGNRTHSMAGYNVYFQQDGSNYLTVGSTFLNHNYSDAGNVNYQYEDAYGSSHTMTKGGVSNAKYELYSDYAYIYASNNSFTKTSKVWVDTGYIELDHNLGNIRFKNLTNLSTQDRLMGQFSTSGQTGYITIGSGLSLSGGVLSSTAADTHIGNTNLTLTGNRTLTQNSFTLNFSQDAGNYFTMAPAYTTFKHTSGTDNMEGWEEATGVYRVSNSSTRYSEFILNPTKVTYKTSNNANTQTSEFLMDAAGIGFYPYNGLLYFDALTNATTQDRLIGQYGTTGLVGYITLGTGLSLSSGVLSSTVVGLTDGDKGDITVSGTGATWTIDNSSVTVAKISATGTPSASTYLRGDGTWSTPSGGSSSLATLTDVSLTSLATNDFLKYNGTSWINHTPANVKVDLSLNNVENTALSTWAGSSNITTVGTIATGTWNATAIADNKIASALTGKTYNGLTLTANATGFSVAGGTTSKTLTVNNTLTLSGTDGSNLNVGAGGTLGTAAFTNSTAYEVPLTFSTGLTRTTNTITVNTTQNISTLSNLTTNGYVKTSGGTGALSVSATVAGSDVSGNISGNAANVTGTVVVANGGTGVGTLTGVVIGNGTSNMSAVAGTGGQLLRRNAGNTAYEFFTPTYLTAEVDGSTSNELQTYAHSGTTSYTNTLSNSGGSFTLNASGILAISHTAGTVTLTATEVDGSTTNELQTIANTSAAGSHTVTLSNSGGSLQLIAGTNVSFSTGGTSGAGTLTISATGTGGGVSDGTYGDIVVSDAGTVWSINSGTVAYGDIQSANANTFLGNPTGSAGSVQEIATNRIPLFASAITGTPSSSTYLRGDGTWATVSGGSGTVTDVSVVTANGFAGSVATSTTTPAITISTTVTGLLKGNGTSVSAATAGTDYVTPTGTETLTNKRIDKRVSVNTSSSTPTPNANTDDVYVLTALATTATFGAPTGTPTAGQPLIIRVKDAGTGITLNWNAAYRGGTQLALPTITVPNKTMYIGFIYNATDSKWDLVSLIDGI